MCIAGVKIDIIQRFAERDVGVKFLLAVISFKACHI
jgi:hypothetical protein